VISDFRPGDLVRTARPDFRVPLDLIHRLGLVIGIVPPYAEDNDCAISQVKVIWTGPRAGKKLITLELDHRIARIFWENR
jgi:hypothetical protein